MKEKKLNILILEDNPDDAELMVRELKKEGFIFEWKRVETEKDFKKALSEKPDIILADYYLPSFDGMAAIKLQRQIAPDIPLILISGSIGEELAVDCLKAGATDYVFKDRLSRLVPVVKRAIKETEENQKSNKAEEAIREGEERFKYLVKNSNDVIVIIDENGKETYVSDSVERITGFSPAEVICHSGFEFLHPDDIDHMSKSLSKLLKTPGVTIRDEYRHRRKGGGWVHLETIGTNYLHKPSINGIVLNIRDITERKKAEQINLRISKIILNDSDGIILTNIEGQINYINPAFEKMSGYTQSELMDKDPANLIVTEDTTAIAEEIRSSVKTKGEWKGELYCKRKNGEIYPIDTRIFAIKNAKDELVEIAAIQQDITERKKTEEELLKEKIFSENLLETANTIIITFDKNANITSFNKFFEELTDYKKEDVLGKNWFDLFIPEQNGSKIPLVFKDVIKKMPEVSSYENPILCKNGSERLISWKNTVLKDENGEISRVLSIGVDITEQKKAEELLRESEKKFRDLANLLPQIVYEIDIYGNLTFVNKQAFDSFGYSQEEYEKGINVLQSLIPEDRDRAKENIQNILYGKEVGNPEYSVLRKDGSTFPVLIYSSAILKDNKPVGLRGIIVDITERKKAEEELRKLSTAVQQSPSVIAITDLKGNLEYVNPKFTDLTRYSSEEAIGQNPRILKSGELPDEMYKELWDTISSGEKWSGEFHNKKKSGELYWEAASISPIFDKQGNITNYLKVAEDITERKQVEDELRLSKTLLRDVMDLVPVFICAKNLDGKFVLVNKKLTDFYGTTIEEMTGMLHADLCEDKNELRSMLADDRLVIENGKPKFIPEETMKNPDGSITVLETNKIPFTAYDEPAVLIASADITERKRAEQIQKVLYNISNAVITTDNLEKLIILIKDQLGTIIDTTNFFIALYDKETDTISLPFFVDEKDKFTSFPARKTLTSYVIKTKKPLLADIDKKKRLVKEGKLEHVGSLSKIWLGVPLRIEGEVTGVLAIQSYTDENAYDESDMEMLEFVSDQISISIERMKAEKDLKLALEKATESDRLKSVFLNTMSHELRTPLNAVIGFSEMIAGFDLSEEEIKDYANTIKTSGNNLVSIVNDIFDITVIETDKVQIVKEKFSVNKTLEYIYSIFIKNDKILNNRINLIIYKELDETSDIIYTDETKLNQILINLVGNAFKFTHKGIIEFGYTVETENGTSFLQFYVKDTGIGIPEDKQSIIFERFRQVDDSDTRKFGGTGLGLFISKRLVELLDGKIWVESEEGKGSTFYFTLHFIPVTKTTDVIADDTKKLEFDWTGKTILVVDDVDLVYIYFKAVLRKTNVQLIRAKNGKEALNIFESNKNIDLILMDIQLTDISGYEVTKQIKKINKDIPIIAQTSYALYGDKEKSLEAGCDDYITKPIRKNELMEKIGKYING